VPYLLNALYLTLIVLGLPWFLYEAWTKGKYRAGYAEKFLGRVPVPPKRGPRVWLHAVSVGEVNLLKPLLAELAMQRPDWECVISTTTLTGYELARKKYPQQKVFYCPLDLSWAVRTALARVQPDLLVLAELELWPNLIHFARQSGAQVAIVNGRLSDRSFARYQRLRGLLRGTLRKINLIAAQDSTSAERFRALGADPGRVTVTGSLKFDGAPTDRENPSTVRLRNLAGILEDDVVFLAGSTQAPEEALALEVWRTWHAREPRLRLLLVPRHPERFAEVAQLLEASGHPWQKRSALEQQPADPDARILLVDTVGELGAWWGTAWIAFVGGSLGSRGGQNMIEPAAYGAAVSFGPRTENFRDITAALLTAQAAVVVRDQAELSAFVGQCLDDPEFAAGLGQRAQSLVLAQQGATRKTVVQLVSLVSPDHPTRRAAA